MSESILFVRMIRLKKGEKMIDRVSADIKDAMKKREKERLSVLRYLKSMLLENKTSKKPKPELEVVILHNKKLKDSFEAYPEGSDQRTNIQNEMVFLKPYLPEQMSEDDVKTIIKEIIGGMETPNMGMIMKELSPKIKGKFDGRLANQFVKEALA